MKKVDGNVLPQQQPQRQLPQPPPPRFPCVCAQCGVDVQVPFKVKVGRASFCRRCYQQ